MTNEVEYKHITDNPTLDIASVVRSYYFKHKDIFNLIIGVLCLFYIQLNQPVRVRRYDYPSSFVEWLI